MKNTKFPTEHVTIAIIGAGPTGLSCAYRLKELGEYNFRIFEKQDYAGGLATTFTDEKGFLWDIGGHVQFSHYEYFDRLMVKLLPNGWYKHARESWVWIFNRFIPYPFQNNIHRLPKEVMMECLDGMVDMYKNALHKAPKNFEEWILQTAGPGIEKYFLYPYNQKVWAHSPRYMNAVWVGERVAVTDLKRVLHNILENKDDLSWGPNNLFQFPKKGGTGAIWNALAEQVGNEHIELNAEVQKIDTTHKKIYLKNKVVEYEWLVNTMPLDIFIKHSDLAGTLSDAAKTLNHSTTYIIGIGMEGKPKAELKTKCWMYFPENNCPFYRATVFSNYSPYNVPDIKKHWSLMLEVASSKYKPVNEKTIIQDCIQGLRNTKLISPKDKIISKWLHKESHGYPTPTLERDAALATIQPELMKRNVLSRGRFGMWKYEVSNQDHSCMQGVEAANYIVHKIPEVTAWFPNTVNAPRPY